MALTKLIEKLNGYKQRDAMLTVACGNSISAQSKWTGSSWNTNGDLQLSNILSGGAMRFKMVTATTRMDRYGVYGYSGALLGKLSETSMLSDISAQWVTPLKNEKVTPDLVVATALLENDLGVGRTFTELKTSIDTFIETVRSTWRGVIIHMVTPRPSGSYNTPTKVSNYQQITSYILGLDNGIDLFVSRGDGYEDLLNPGKPISIAITASISGTTLTVASGSGLKIGQYITTTDGTGLYGLITAFGTGTGGSGTYTLSVSSTVASTSLLSMVYTDALVHPNATGALLLARVQAATLKRISKVWKQPFSSISTNMAMEGSTTVSGATGSGAVTGTYPTGVFFGTSAAIGGTIVDLAEQPGFKITVNANAGSGANVSDLANHQLPAIAVSGVTQVSPFAKVEILSGASNIRNIQLEPRILDGGGNSFQYFIRVTGSESEPDWQDGDIMTIIVPPLIANSGSITQVTNYIRCVPKMSGGAFSFRIISHGVGIIETGTTVLTDAATINIDAAITPSTFRVTLGGNRTIANPTSPADGKILRLSLVQDATGSRTVTWGTAFRFNATYPSPTLTTTAAKTDYLEFRYNSIDAKWDCIRIVQGI